MHSTIVWMIDTRCSCALFNGSVTDLTDLLPKMVGHQESHKSVCRIIPDSDCHE